LDGPKEDLELMNMPPDPQRAAAFPVKDRRQSTCALCGERVDLREEHYRMASEFRVHRATVHVECYRKLKRERPE
jgi:hypothetical protein